MSDTDEVPDMLGMLDGFTEKMEALAQRSYDRGSLDYAESMLEAFQAVVETGRADEFTVQDSIEALEASIKAIRSEMEQEQDDE